MPSDRSAALIALAHELGALKRLVRTGWALRGVPHPESVADHCFRTAFLAMLLTDLCQERGLSPDGERVLRMALLHEAAECRIGDLPAPASRYFPQDAKQIAERRAVAALLRPLGALGETYQVLFDEYAEQTSLESRIVRAADLAEMLLQALEYEPNATGSLDEFWQGVRQFVAELDPTSPLREFFETLYHRRENRREKGDQPRGEDSGKSPSHER